MWNKATGWVVFGDRRPQRRQAHRYRVSVFLQLARGMTSLTRVPMATPRASPRRVGVARLIRPFLDEPGGGALDNYNEQLGGAASLLLPWKRSPGTQPRSPDVPRGTSLAARTEPCPNRHHRISEQGIVDGLSWGPPFLASITSSRPRRDHSANGTRLSDSYASPSPPDHIEQTWST
jgi:hypothetical protein